jgi:hypothetical protein
MQLTVVLVLGHDDSRCKAHGNAIVACCVVAARDFVHSTFNTCITTALTNFLSVPALSLRWRVQVLSNSYAFAYFFFGGQLYAEEFSEDENRVNQNLFEDSQEMLAGEVNPAAAA